MDEDDQKTGLGQRSELLDGLLPKILLGPARTAISRLIGSGIDIQALATQAAKTAVTDPGIMERAEANMVATTYRRQINKEAMALKTIKNL